MRHALMAVVLLAGAACNGDDGHADDGGRPDGSSDASLTAEQELCNCLLIDCHDPFHARYGEGDEVAIPACEADAQSIPRAEMPTMSGNFIECRAAFCELAATDATSCAAALGGAPCM